MKPRMIAYWTANTLIALETFAGGIVDLTHGRTGVFSGIWGARAHANSSPRPVDRADIWRRL